MAILLISGCSNLVGCSKEAKICPDGSTVGRHGLNCEFSPCPVISCQTDNDCKNLTCLENQNQIPKDYSICESNKCVCGCGDPENGIYCK